MRALVILLMINKSGDHHLGCIYNSVKNGIFVHHIRCKDFCNHQLRRDVSQIHPKMSQSFSLRFLSLETQGDWTRGSASGKWGLEDLFQIWWETPSASRWVFSNFWSAKSLREKPTASPGIPTAWRPGISRDFKESGSDLPFCAQQLRESPRTCLDSQWNVWRSCIAIGRGWVLGWKWHENSNGNERCSLEMTTTWNPSAVHPWASMKKWTADGWQAVRHLPYLQTLDVSRNRIAYQANCFDALFFVDIWWRISWNLSQPWFIQLLEISITLCEEFNQMASILGGSNGVL